MRDFSEDSETTARSTVQVNVRGDNEHLWAKLRPKLLARINALLNTPLDEEHGTTVREEAKKLTSGLLEFARQRLQKSGLENEKIEAEIADLYAAQQERLAKSEHESALAASVRQQTDTRALITSLALTKAMLIGEEGEEAILFGRRIDEFLKIVKEMGLIADA